MLTITFTIVPVNNKNKNNNKLGKTMRDHIRREFSEVARELSTKQTQKKKKQKSTAITVPPKARLAVDFAHAIAAPFDPASIGIRVPDIFSFPTATYHVHGVTTLSTSSGSGIIGGAFLPNPVVSFIDTKFDSGSLTCVNSSGMTNIAFATTPAGPSPCWSAITPTNLGTVLSSYRVASWGIRIKNLMTPLNATGRLYIAIVPSPQEVPSYYAITKGTIGYMVNSFIGPGITNNSSILELPVSQEVSVTEMLSGAIQITPAPVNPVFYNFRSAAAAMQVGTDVFDGTHVTSPASGATATPAGISLTSLTGGSTVLVYADGLPLSTNCFEVEYIYHIEGTPVLSSTNDKLVTASNATSTGSTAIVEAAIQANPATRAINFLDEAQQMAGMVMRGMEKAYEFANSPIGRGITTSILALL